MVRLEIRYNTKDHNGQTRADRNRMADHPVPEIVVPKHGLALWRVFWSVNRLRHERAPLQPGAILDWHRMHGKRLATLDAAVIEAMDRKFLDTLGEEIRMNEDRRTATK